MKSHTEAAHGRLVPQHPLRDVQRDPIGRKLTETRYLFILRFGGGVGGQSGSKGQRERPLIAPAR